MSQQETTPSTTVRKRVRRKPVRNYSGNRIEMISAKESAIPVPVQDFDSVNNIITWGKKNEYPYYLNYLAKSNPIHGGILNAKTYFTVSGGLIYEGSQQAEFDVFAKNKKSNPQESNLQKVVEELSRSFERSNIGILKIFFSQVGERKYRKMEVIPFEKFRFEATEINRQVFLTGNIKVSENWFDKNTEIQTLEPYNPNNQDQRFCFAMVIEKSGQSIDNPKKPTDINLNIYPSPTYSGAILAIDTNTEIGIYNNSEIHNGFSLGTLVYLAGGVPKNKNDKKDLERDLGGASTGALQAGRSMVIYGNGQDQKPKIEALNGNNLPDRYSNVKKGSEESTVHGHSLTTPILAGIKTEGSLGNATELELGYAIFKQNYILARQNMLLETINWIMNNIAQVQGLVSFGEVKLNLEVSEDNRAGQSLNEMSPLVATKVLSAMSQNEIRSLAKLAPKEGGDELPKATVFQADDVILERLKKLGSDRNKFEVIHSLSIDKGEKDKQSIIDDYKGTFAKLNEVSAKVLGLINSGEDYENIKTVLDLSTNEINRIYNELYDNDLINDNGEITTAGKRQVAILDVESIEIMYSYELRSDAPPLVPGGTSRPFCKELMSLNRLYSREDINLISGIEGYNVFAYRGGWYHNSQTDKNEPSCRHEWRQVIVFK